MRSGKPSTSLLVRRELARFPRELWLVCAGRCIGLWPKKAVVDSRQGCKCGNIAKKSFGGLRARTVMVARYWFGIHKVADATESAVTSAADEPSTTAKEPAAYDFSNLDWNDDQHPPRIHDARDQTGQQPGSDMPYSWIGLDLSAKPPVAPTAKDR